MFQEWLIYSAREVESMYANWLPASIDTRQLLDVMKIPHLPYYSFGEPLPVLEESGNGGSGFLSLTKFLLGS